MKTGNGDPQTLEDMKGDTYGFERLDWEAGARQEKDLKAILRTLESRVAMDESEMTGETCYWEDDGKKKGKTPKCAKGKNKGGRKGAKGRSKETMTSVTPPLGPQTQINALRTVCQRLGNDPGNTVLAYDDYVLQGEDILNLQYDEWMSDANIAVFYAMLKWCFFASDPVVLLAPTFAFLLGNYQDPAQLASVLPREMAKAEVVFLPVNDNVDFADAQGGTHWSLVVCLPKLRMCFGLDSMQGANDREMRQLAGQLGAFYESDFEYRELWTPQQRNGSDCGVVVLALTALYVARIIALEAGEIVQWDLQGVRVNPLACRVWMARVVEVIAKGT